jgi:DnaJ-class molecular chaperone
LQDGGQAKALSQEADMSLNSYQELNLREGASIDEIKAAFRSLAKSCHPDAGGRNQADVEKFIKGQSAYQKLMKTALAHNRSRRAATQKDEPPVPGAARHWRFGGRREIGLDVYCRLSVLRPRAGEGLKIVLPWQAREACPRCLGQGRTLSKVGSNSLYRPCACDKCGGLGVIVRETRLEVDFSAAMVGQGKIRLRKAGLYNAKQAERGDLILEVAWVDHLPAAN